MTRIKEILGKLHLDLPNFDKFLSVDFFLFCRLPSVMIGVKVTNVGLIFAIISLANHKPMLSFKKVAVKNQSLCRRFIFWGFRGPQ